jgi:hypothetical protein
LKACTNCRNSGVGAAFRSVGFGHAENFAEREQRQARRERLDQIAFTKARHAVDQPRGLGRHLFADGGEIA